MLSRRTATARRKAAETRKREVEQRLANLPDQRKRIEEETEHRLKYELESLEEANQRSLELMQQELEDRKREEMHAVAMQMKAEIVNTAIEQLVKEYKAKAAPGLQSSLIDQFAGEVERLS